MILSGQYLVCIVKEDRVAAIHIIKKNLKNIIKKIIVVPLSFIVLG